MARGSVVVIVALQLLMINDLHAGPQLLAPVIELALLIPLSTVTAWVQAMTRKAETDDHWFRVARHRRMIRKLAVVLTAVITLLNTAALLNLVRVLLKGHLGESGETLLLDALNIWATNVIIFALWFWSIDRGGPATRGLLPSQKNDFLFPQMMLDSYTGWSPGFVDYLYLSFTNATAFSPTDTMPLTSRTKLLMMAESAISLLTIALVAARAVNILS